jgi:hypothetical protein
LLCIQLLRVQASNAGMGSAIVPSARE